MKTLQDLFGLKGKTALVTGASSGLGVEFAKGLAMAGADVAIVARRKERLEEVAGSLEAFGVKALPVEADLTIEADLEAAVSQVEKELAPVDILVNNAGVAPLGRAEKHSAENWDQAISVNLTAVFRLSQRVGRAMIERGAPGRIINVSSVVAEVGNAIFPTVGYAASKAGVNGMTRQMAVEWAPHGITVNAIEPAWFPTEMNIDPRHGDVHPKFKDRMEALTPLGRLGTPDELMGALVFLASSAGSYVTVSMPG